MAEEHHPDPRFEGVLGDAFSAVGESFRPTTGPRLDEVTARGRALRRRRTAAFAGGVTAVAVIGVGGVFAAGLGAAPARSGGSVEAPAAPSSAASPVPSPSVLTRPAQANPDAVPPSAEAHPEGGEVLAVAATLLPAGLAPADASTGEGFARFNVDDGRGKSEVQVYVAKQPAGAPDPRYDYSTVLPDGSRLVVQQGAPMSGSGSVRWSVEILHPDGTRVVVRAFNTAVRRNTAKAEPGRSTPPLTLDQLRAIATSPTWLQHSGKK
ncbi:hypothetical protein [Kitasatospora purpeofusca]|uniref:hypothetical protein n=1 Tax=Kitasatospora purpeofusca TaxID=67352 RepID=UPI0004C0C312|nr:hypothetical protein [Kitasatospora purpeofusca]